MNIQSKSKESSNQTEEFTNNSKGFSSDESEDEEEVMKNVDAEAKLITQTNTIPIKSAERYLLVYHAYKKWLQDNSASLSDSHENNLIVYFNQLKEKAKPPTLWSIWSMLKNTLSSHDDINIKNFTRLKSLISSTSKMCTKPVMEKLSTGSITAGSSTDCPVQLTSTDMNLVENNQNISYYLNWDDFSEDFSQESSIFNPPSILNDGEGTGFTTASNNSVTVSKSMEKAESSSITRRPFFKQPPVKLKFKDTTSKSTSLKKRKVLGELNNNLETLQKEVYKDENFNNSMLVLGRNVRFENCTFSNCTFNVVKDDIQNKENQ